MRALLGRDCPLRVWCEGHLPKVMYHRACSGAGADAEAMWVWKGWFDLDHTLVGPLHSCGETLWREARELSDPLPVEPALFLGGGNRIFAQCRERIQASRQRKVHACAATTSIVAARYTVTTCPAQSRQRGEPAPTCLSLGCANAASLRVWRSKIPVVPLSRTSGLN